MVGIPRKFEIPYKGPFRIIKLFGNNVIVADGDKEVTYNITKTIKLRNFTIPQRDLYGRIVRNVDDHLDESIEDTFARAKVLTDKLLQLKREGQLYKLAKQKVRESAPFDDNQEEKVDSVAKTLREHEKALKKIATTKIQPKLTFLPSTLQPGNFAIANVLNQNRLVQILEVRLVQGDSIPWVKVHIFSSIDPLGSPERQFKGLYLEKGREVLRQVQPPGSRIWWAEIYPSDILFKCSYPLTHDRKIDPRDWSSLTTIYGKSLQILSTSTSTFSYKRRKIHRQ